MFDLETRTVDGVSLPIGNGNAASPEGRDGFLWTKRVFDVVVSAVLLPVLVLAGLALLVLNPFFNRGPLLFIQTRMGQNCTPFRAIKFRSMVEVENVVRKADDPLEHDRITPPFSCVAQ